MSKKAQRQNRQARQEAIRSRNRIFGGAALAAVLVAAIGGAILLNGNGSKAATVDVGGTNPQRYTYSDGSAGFEFSTVWGNSRVSDTSVDVIPGSDGGSVLADAIRDAAGKLIGCNVYDIEVGDNWNGEHRNDIARKEAATARACDELGQLGVLDQYDTHGLYSDGTDAGLANVQQVIDARTVAIMMTDPNFRERSGIAPELANQYAENYNPNTLDCPQKFDMLVMTQAGQIAQQAFPAGFFDECPGAQSSVPQNPLGFSLN